MPNISTTNKNAIFKYTATIKTLFENDEDPITLDFFRIKTITLDYSFDKFCMPLVYCTVAMTYEQVKKFKENLNGGVVLLTVQKYVENSDMPGLMADYIKTECNYFMPTDIGKDKEQVINPDRTEDYGYVFTMGFISTKLIQQNKNNKNGILSKGTLSAAINYVLSGHKLLMEPLVENKILTQTFLPVMKSTNKAIKYLNSMTAFYDTKYRFFMDFDTTYLISSSGKGIKRKGEDISLIKLTLMKDYRESNMEGMYEDKENKMYLISISGSNANLYESNMVDKEVTDIKAVTTEGKTTTKQVTETEQFKKDKSISTYRVMNDNERLTSGLKADILNSSTSITVIKNKIDGSIFTINKMYYIDASQVYGSQYSGYYLLSSRKEVYLQEGTGYAMSIMLRFNKINGVTKEDAISKA